LAEPYTVDALIGAIETVMDPPASPTRPH